MQRKWLIALSSMFAFSVVAVGISLADDEGGPLHELMEKVNKKSADIKKAYRSPVTFKKGQKDIVANTEELIKLSKDARGMAKEAAKKAKNIKDVDKEWTELCDAFTKELQKFQDVLAKPNATNDQVKKAYLPVGASCTNCHNKFRVEEESF